MTAVIATSPDAAPEYGSRISLETPARSARPRSDRDSWSSRCTAFLDVAGRGRDAARYRLAADARADVLTGRFARAVVRCAGSEQRLGIGESLLADDGPKVGRVRKALSPSILPREMPDKLVPGGDRRGVRRVREFMQESPDVGSSAVPVARSDRPWRHDMAAVRSRRSVDS